MSPPSARSRHWARTLEHLLLTRARPFLPSSFQDVPDAPFLKPARKFKIWFVLCETALIVSKGKGQRVPLRLALFPNQSYDSFAQLGSIGLALYAPTTKLEPKRKL